MYHESVQEVLVAIYDAVTELVFGRTHALQMYPEYEELFRRFLRLGSQSFKLWSETEIRPLPHLPASLPLLPPPLNPLPCQLLPALTAHPPLLLLVSLGLLTVPLVQADSAFP